MSEVSLLEIRRILIAANREDLATLLTHNEPTEEEIQYHALAQEFSVEDLEFDEQPLVSISEDGAFVSAWIWVPAPDGREVAA